MSAGIVGIMGIPVSSGNRGVMALGASLLYLLENALPRTNKILLLNHDKHEECYFRIGQEVKGVTVIPARLAPMSRLQDHLAFITIASIFYRLIPFSFIRRTLKRLFPWIRATAEATLVGDIRGGDSFSDIYGMRRFLIGFFMSWSVILIRKEIVQFPQTYGPFGSPLARILAGFLLKRSSVIMARDGISKKEAEGLTQRKRAVWLCPDVAFSLLPIKPREICVYPILPDNKLPTGIIGLNVNGLMYNGGYTRANMFGLKLDYRKLLMELTSAFPKWHEQEFWLLPHVYAPPGDVESDPDACEAVYQAMVTRMQRNARIVRGNYDCHELKWIIGQFDFFVGSRIHSCIAALSQGVPCVGIAYSRKFRGVFDTVGMGDWVVDARELDEEQALARIIELYQHRDSVRKDLKARAEQAQKELEEVFGRLLKGTGGEE